GAHDAALCAAAFVAPIGRRKVVTHRVRAITCGCGYRTAVVCWAQTGARPRTGVAIARRFSIGFNLELLFIAANGYLARTGHEGGCCTEKTSEHQKRSEGNTH